MLSHCHGGVTFLEYYYYCQCSAEIMTLKILSSTVKTVSQRCNFDKPIEQADLSHREEVD